MLRGKSEQVEDSDNSMISRIGARRLGSSNVDLEQLRTREILFHTRPNSSSRLLVFSSTNDKIRQFLRKHEIIEDTIVERISRWVVLLDIKLYGSLCNFNCGVQETRLR